MSTDAQVLAERLGEMIEEYSGANTVSVSDVLDALEYAYACVERFNDNMPRVKMH